MKFFTSSLSDLILKINSGTIKAFLVYGVNHGLAKTIIEKIIQNQNLIVSEFNIKEISVNKLLLVANNKNFFGKKELIKITNINGTISKDLQQCIIENNFEHLVCFYAEDSLPANGIRNFFEKEKNIASIGCYYEDENTITKIILQQCKKWGKTISNEALLYLKTHLKGDNQIIKSELNKIFYFTHDKSEITQTDVISTLSSDLMASGDEMCIFFAKKESNNFLAEVEKLKQENKNEVLILRSLSRYYLNIYTICLKVENGENIDLAIKSLSPPIFFKYISDFKQIVKTHTSQDAIKILQNIQNAEISYKKNPNTFDFYYVYAHTTFDYN